MKYGPAIVKRICDLIESDDYTVKELCHNAGISEAIYFKWKNDNLEFLDALNKAEERRLERFRVAARSGLMTLLQGKEVEEIVTEYKEGKPDPNNPEAIPKPKIVSRTVRKKFYMPNAGMVAFALKNLDEDNFIDTFRNEHTGAKGAALPATDIDYSKLPTEMLLAIANARVQKTV